MSKDVGDMAHGLKILPQLPEYPNVHFVLFNSLPTKKGAGLDLEQEISTEDYVAMIQSSFRLRMGLLSFLHLPFLILRLVKHKLHIQIYSSLFSPLPLSLCSQTCFYDSLPNAVKIIMPS